jgi:hypothetical protein
MNDELQRELKQIWIMLTIIAGIILVHLLNHF